MRLTIIVLLVLELLLTACATGDSDIRRTRLRECPPGMIQVCESREQREPSRGGDEEIPEYEFCRCIPAY